jgi:hypothetical protein
VRGEGGNILTYSALSERRRNPRVSEIAVLKTKSPDSLEIITARHHIA